MKQKGFTLIELMVVISIIAMLSSIILASLSTARARANLAASEEFAANIYHSIGDQMIGQWTFDATSNPLVDTSGFNQNGVLIGSATYKSSGGYNGFGYYNFPGSSGNGIVANINSVPATEMTFLMWINPNSSGELSLAKNWGNVNEGAFWLELNGNKLSAVFPNTAGNLNGTLPVTSGTWHLVGFVANGSTIQEIVDGKFGASVAQTGPFITNFLCLGIGAKPTQITNSNGTYGCGPSVADYSFNGGIDDVRWYSSNLTETAIDQIYAEGRITHPFALNAN